MTEVLETRPQAGSGRRAGRLALTLLSGLTVMVAGVSVMAFTGEHWWVLDLTASFRVQYLAFLAIAVVTLLAGRRWVAAVIAGGGLLVNLVVVAPLFLGSPAAAVPGAPTLEVMSFNVHASNDHYQEVIDQIRATDADLVFVIEVTKKWESAFEEAGLPIIAGRKANGTADMLVIAPRPYPVGTVSLTGRDAVLVRVPLGESTVNVLGVHPVSPTKGAYDYRRDQMLGSVGEWASGASGPVVVIGDLNSTPWTKAFRDLASSGLIDSLRGHGIQPSWPAGFGPFMIPIDHALHTPDLTTVERRTGPADGSDHRSLIVTVAPAAD